MPKFLQSLSSPAPDFQENEDLGMAVHCAATPAMKLTYSLSVRFKMYEDSVWPSLNFQVLLTQFALPGSITGFSL